jgi:hypothetical protein
MSVRTHQLGLVSPSISHALGSLSLSLSAHRNLRQDDQDGR